MYLVIAYHGSGKNKVEDVLRLLWDHIRSLAKFRSIQHIYCFQAIKDRGGADTIIVIQYDNVAAKLALPEETKQASQTRHQVDHWFYLRNRSQKQGGLK
ncbi:MAG: hypothetical protein ABH815_00335 [Candidatus Omnitrophota bacterium]